MITKLTKSQQAKMPEYVNEWIQIGTKTDRLNYDRTVDIIHDLQEHLLDSPKTPVLIFDDPAECWVACHFADQGTPVNDIKGKVDEYFAGKIKLKLEPFALPYLTGSFDSHVFAFYDFFKNELNIDFKESTKKYEIWRATSEIGMIFPLPTVAIVCEKPEVIKLGENRRIHCDGGPAVRYKGRGHIQLFALNGTIVPEFLAVTPAEQLDLARYNDITNADVRMEFVRKVGIERMLTKGKLVDSHTKYKDTWWTKSEYELWDMHELFPGIAYAPHLKMLNQTTKVFHVEAVSPDCKTLEQAIHERLGERDLDIQAIA